MAQLMMEPAAEADGHVERHRKRRRQGAIQPQYQTLRQCLTSPRLFWTTTLIDQLNVEAFDHNRDRDRALAPNEIAVLALNEIAAHRREGFFFHLLARPGWSRWGTAFPQHRHPSPPGADFPSIVFMRYTWSDASQQSFFATSHRVRYLASEFYANPPRTHTPLYSLQYAARPGYPLYNTTECSLVALATKTNLYLLTTTQLATAIGMWRGGNRPAGPDPQRRLATAQFLWSRQHTGRRTWAGEDTELDDRLAPYKMESLEAAYNMILQMCRDDVMPSSTSAGDLQRALPHPANARPGIQLGTVTPSADLRSSRARGQFGSWTRTK